MTQRDETSPEDGQKPDKPMTPEEILALGRAELVKPSDPNRKPRREDAPLSSASFTFPKE